MSEEQFFLLDGREVVVTADMHPSCDGGNGPLGHPVEWLTLERGARTRCKYCDRLYLHTSNPDAAAVRERGEPVVPA